MPFFCVCVCACVCACACLFAFAHAWPQVYEAVRCHRECSQYEWKTDSWSICTINTVDDLPACGEGVQSRKIRSVSRSTRADSEPGTALHTGRSRLATTPGTHAGPDTGGHTLQLPKYLRLILFICRTEEIVLTTELQLSMGERRGTPTTCNQVITGLIYRERQLHLHQWGIWCLPLFGQLKEPGASFGFRESQLCTCSLSTQFQVKKKNGLENPDTWHTVQINKQ